MIGFKIILIFLIYCFYQVQTQTNCTTNSNGFCVTNYVPSYTASGLTDGQIAGIVIGWIFGVILLYVAGVVLIGFCIKDG